MVKSMKKEKKESRPTPECLLRNSNKEKLFTICETNKPFSLFFSLPFPFCTVVVVACNRIWRPAPAVEDRREGCRRGRRGKTIREERGEEELLPPKYLLAYELKVTSSFQNTVIITRSWKLYVLKLVGSLKMMAPLIARLEFDSMLLLPNYYCFCANFYNRRSTYQLENSRSGD